MPPSAIPEGPSQREQILKTAAQLFAERGYHAIGMTELCDAVGLGRGALYHHIRSKEEVLYDISRNYITELIASGEKVLASEADPCERVRKLGTRLMRKIATHQPELTVCFREVHSLTGERHATVMDLHARYEGLWRAVMRDGVKRGVFRTDSAVVLKGLLGMYFYSYLWFKPNAALGPDGVATHFNEIALRGLRV